MKVCLATVVTREFIPGAFVMLHSFIECNKWFYGEIVIFYENLDQDTINTFNICFNSFDLKWRTISKDLKLLLYKLSENFPGRIPQRFYSMEVFSLKGYDKVLFFDSDLLFLKDVRSLVTRDSLISGCRSGVSYLNEVSDKSGFNAGMFVIDKVLLTEAIYRELLNILVVDNWKKLEPTVFNDQAIYNKAFGGSITIIEQKYNFLLSFHAVISEYSEANIDNSYVIHFNGPIKPWVNKHVLESICKDPVLSKSFKLWSDVYSRIIQKLSLLHKIL